MEANENYLGTCKMIHPQINTVKKILRDTKILPPNMARQGCKDCGGTGWWYGYACPCRLHRTKIIGIKIDIKERHHDNHDKNLPVGQRKD